MKTFRYISTSAALLLLTLGAMTARADTGYVYALILDTGTPQVQAPYTLNPGGGGPVTVTRTGTGSYTVAFPNSGIGDGWAAEATAFGATAGYCNVTGFGGPSYVIYVQCYNSSGAAANSSFTALAVSNQNDKNIAFALVAQATPGSAYAADPSFSFNPDTGGVSVASIGTGSYDVFFGGLSASGGTVQIGAFESNATCYSAGWSSVFDAFTATVACFDPSGNNVNTDFVIFIVPAGVTPTGIAFTLADQSSTTTYTPQAEFSYNPTGSAVNVTRSSTGQYTVTYAGLNAAQVSGGNVLATSGGVATRCNVVDWGPGPGSTFDVQVNCYNLVGGATDSDFLILALPPMGYAYALVNASASVSPAFTLNPGGAPVTASHTGTGSYTVTFPNSGIGVGWVPQVVSYGAVSNYCNAGGWTGGVITIFCFNFAGSPANSAFVVAAFSNTNGKNIAFSKVDQATTSAYAADPSFTYNPGGTICVGSYGSLVIFNGLNGGPGGAQGTVQLTAVGAGGEQHQLLRATGGERGGPRSERLLRF